MPHPLVGQPPAAPLADPRAAGTARRTVACHWLHLGPEEPFGASFCRKMVSFKERHRVLATGDIPLSIQNGPVLHDPGRPIGRKRLSGGSFSAPSAFAKALPPAITP